MAFGVIESRGGVYLSGIEEFISNIFKRYSITKHTKSTRIVPVDFRMFKGFGGHIYGFLIFTKFILRR